MADKRLEQPVFVGIPGPLDVEVVNAFIREEPAAARRSPVGTFWESMEQLMKIHGHVTDTIHNLECL